MLRTETVRTSFEPVGDFRELGRRWRALEREGDSRFFRGWTFLGCRALDRFGRAHLLAITQDGSDVALALVGEGQGKFWLNQTGSAEADSCFIEHNGPLVRAGEESIVQTALHYLAGYGRAVALSGVTVGVLRQAQAAGWLGPVQDRLAPCVALDALRAPYIATLSANARAQLRRSMRLYGPGLRLRRAEASGQALEWLGEMIVLHQTAWRARGHPGAFAGRAMQEFHAALVARAWPRGEADLLRVEVDNRVVGLLYNFISGGRVMSYQSGFAYDPARPQEKPGLVCHALAIQHYADRGACLYDLLAGADRYKLTLARGTGEILHWTTLHRRWSPGGVMARARRGLAAIRTSLLRPGGRGPDRPGQS